MFTIFIRQTQRLWVSQQLRSAGLEVFHQNFSCQNKAIQGENIYGILRWVLCCWIDDLHAYHFNLALSYDIL